MKLYTGTQQTLAAYNEEITSNSRAFKARLICYTNNGLLRTGYDAVKSFELSDYVIEGSDISMGCVAGGKLTATLTKLSSAIATSFYDGMAINLQLDLLNLPDDTSFGYSYLRTPLYVIDEHKLTKRRKGADNEQYYDCTITAYALPYIMTKNSTGNYTALSFVQHIASKYSGTGYSLSVDGSVAAAITAIDGSNPRNFALSSDFDDKHNLGYIAGCYGCYAEINEDNAICFKWYEHSSDTVAPNRIFSGGAYVSEMEQRSVKILESGTGDNAIVKPNNASGHSINFENPYISDAQATAIYNAKISGDKIAYRLGKVHYKGNPLNNPGTILTVKDVDNEEAAFYIMKRKISFDGGLSETIECVGNSDTTLSFRQKFSTRNEKINRALTLAEEAIKKATDIITQTQGSVFELIPINPNDKSQGLAGFKLYSTAAGNQNLIMGTAGGIGFSSNGGESMDAAAIYIDDDGGHINANFINVGVLRTDMLISGEHALRTGSGNVVIDNGGVNIYNGKLAIYSGAIDETDETVEPIIKIEADKNGMAYMQGNIRANSLDFIGDYNLCELNYDNRYTWGFVSYLQGDWLSYDGDDPDLINFSSWQNITEEVCYEVSGKIKSDARLNGRFLKPCISIWLKSAKGRTFFSIDNESNLIQASADYPEHSFRFTVDAVGENKSALADDDYFTQMRVSFIYYNPDASNYREAPNYGKTHFKDIVVRATSRNGKDLINAAGNVHITGTGIDIYNGAINIYKTTDSSSEKVFGADDNGNLDITGNFKVKFRNLENNHTATLKITNEDYLTDTENYATATIKVFANQEADAFAKIEAYKDDKTSVLNIDCLKAVAISSIEHGTSIALDDKISIVGHVNQFVFSNQVGFSTNGVMKANDFVFNDKNTSIADFYNTVMNYINSH